MKNCLKLLVTFFALACGAADLYAAAPSRVIGGKMVGGVIKRKVVNGAIIYKNGSTGTTCYKRANGEIICLDRFDIPVEPAEKLYQQMEDLYEATGDEEMRTIQRRQSNQGDL